MVKPGVFHSNKKRKLLGHAFVLLAMLLAVVAVDAQTPGELSEYDLKTAFLYQFTLYVEWPADQLGPANQPLVFGVVGANEIANNLKQLTTDNVQGHPIEVRELEPGADVSGLHVLFVAQSQQAQSAAMLQAAAADSILAVTENGSGLLPNSVINFALVDGKVRFDVSLTNAQAADLEISSRLLQIARSVAGRP
ncbi:MAG: YfiR family protein [Pseudomonadota bacterium]